MKKINFLFAAFGLLASGLSSCSSDDPMVVDKKVEFDQKQYLAVQISAPSAATRAFENGAQNESYVDHLDFLFYDVAGNPTAAPYPMDSFAEDAFTDQGNGENVTRICKALVEVNLTQGQNLPSQVICIVNGESSAVNELKTKNLNELINVERNYFRNDSYFVMSNSVYYGQNILTGLPEQRLCATPINANTQLFSTEDAAKKVLDDNTDGALLDIYVERVAAKVGLTLDYTAVNDYTLVNGEGGANVTIKFTPEYWAMNATANTNYLTKRYGVDTGGADGIVMNPNYSQINTALSNANWTTWNDEPNRRSYWGCSPSYFDNTYPFVSDEVNDLEGRTTTSQTTTIAGNTNVTIPVSKKNFPVTYYSYNEVASQAGRTDDGGIGKQALAAVNNSFSSAVTAPEGGYDADNTYGTSAGYIYTRETTVASKTIRDIEHGNPLAAVASAIVVGKYNVTGATTEDGTFYINTNAGVIGGKTVGTYYGSMSSARTALSNRQRIVFTTAIPGAVSTDVRPAAGIFTLKHPSAAVRAKAETRVAGRLVALQIETLPAYPLYFYKLNATGEGSYVQINANNLDEVNAQLLSVGYMDMYKAGHAFFSIPVHHLNWTDANCLDQTTGAYKWATMPVGALGVVRNHVYNINVTRVSGLAAGLRDDDQPIVPAKDEYNMYIAARINILSWNVVPTQNVVL